MTNMEINRSEIQGLSDCGPVLYLDFDGVLHHHNVLWSASKGPYLDASSSDRLFEHAPLLVELLEPHSAVRIVLSTSWAVKYGCHGAARRLPFELRTRVIGATYHSQMNRAEFESAYRGMQVWADVFRRRPSDWMAIDDDVLQWPAWCRDKLVKSHSERGLADPTVVAQVRLGLQRITCAQ
ncbi:HAD domain-containing protein [Comamonas testosteroni]|uniref:HAD domain-containing protein n=1 Tax=Comamonas testosteroni TaxID=285 RepID=UPI00389A9512